MVTTCTHPYGSGPTVALYFLWLEFYTSALIMPSILGECHCVSERVWPVPCSPGWCVQRRLAATGGVVELVRLSTDTDREAMKGVSVDHLMMFG